MGNLLPVPKRGLSIATKRPASEKKSLLVLEIREAKREAQKLLAELSRLEAIAVAAERRPNFGNWGFGAQTLRNKTQALNGWILSLVESAIAIDIFDNQEIPRDRRADQKRFKRASRSLGDEFIAATDQILSNENVFLR